MNQSRLIQQARSTPATPNFTVSNPFFGLLPREYVKRRKEFFVYNVRFDPINASQTLVGTANVQNDSDFAFVLGMASVRQDNGTSFPSQGAFAPFLVQLSDNASGNQMQDSPTHIDNLFGTQDDEGGVQPAILPVPKIFQSGGQITAQLQNQDTVNGFIVCLSFIGFKIYRMPTE